MEIVKRHYPTAFVPMGAIVTAAGTGSEMNNGAVITNEEKKLKAGIWAAQADFAFLDPMYTMSVPMKQVISGAFDTLSHAMETYFGKPVPFITTIPNHRQCCSTIPIGRPYPYGKHAAVIFISE